MCYVVSEYWTAGGQSAIKGDDLRTHGIFLSVEEANIWEVLEPYARRIYTKVRGMESQSIRRGGMKTT